MEGQQKHCNFWPRYLNDPILKIYFLHLFVQKLATNSHHFLAGKNNKIDSKMTKMPLPEMHCTSNSLSHKLITRSLDPPAVDLGDSVGIHVNVAFNKKLRRQITPPNNHKSYIETPFSRKKKSMQMSPGQFWRGHLSTNTCQSFLKSICCLFSTSCIQFNTSKKSKNLH